MSIYLYIFGWDTKVSNQDYKRLMNYISLNNTVECSGFQDLKHISTIGQFNIQEVSVVFDMCWT